MQDLLLPGSLIFYVVGIFLAAAGTVYRSQAGRQGAIFVLMGAWALHLAAIFQHGLDAGRFPIANLGEFVLVLGWVVQTVYLVVWLRYKVHVAGLLLPPIAALAALGALQLLDAERGTAAPPGTHQGLFLFHTGISTVGMAVLCLALAMSLIYLIQDRALKHKQAGGLLDRLPSLQRCDRIGYASLWLGFVMLSLGIGTGVLVNAEIHQRLLSLGFKQTMPLLAWIIFATILVSRLVFGFRGRKSAYLTIAGVAVGLLTVAGMTM